MGKSWWQALPVAMQWLLFLPAVALSTAIVFVPVIVVVRLLNSSLWGSTFAAVAGASLLAWLSTTMALNLAPTRKRLAATLVLLPMTCLATLTLLRALAPGNDERLGSALWGVSWVAIHVWCLRQRAGY